MQIKIADRPLWRKIAVLWFIFAAIQFWAANNYYASVYFFSGITFILLGISFLKRKNLTYLTLKSDMIIVHRQSILGKKKIRYNEIKKGEVLGKEIIFYLNNGHKYKLKNEWITYKDFSKLKKELETHSITVH